MYENEIAQYVQALNDASPRHSGEQYMTFAFEPNTSPRGKYSRVVSNTGGSYGRAVHAFIDAQGNVYKSAGWKTPAPGVRYSLATPEGLALLLHNASGSHSFSGGYLYANRQQALPALIG